MVQKLISCCSKKPSYLVFYSVAGSTKSYLVCLSCIKINCFSKYVIKSIKIKNQKIFQNELLELFDDSFDSFESIDEQVSQSEHVYEQEGQK